MLIGGKRRTLHTIDVFEQDAPAVGRQLRDPHGRKWTVRGRRQGLDITLRNPPAPFPPWQLDIEAEHPAYEVSAGEELTPIFTLDEVRAARDAAKEAFPQLRGVGVSDDNQRLIFLVATTLECAVLPMAFRGMPIDIRTVQ